MMDKLLSLDDIVIIPETISNIEHRSQCDVTDNEGKLPIFAAPMSCVIDDKNYNKFEAAGIRTVIPRNIDFKERFKLSTKVFVAVSLSEFSQIIEMDRFKDVHHICVDIANGHMKKLFNMSKIAKEKFGDHLVLMIGNVANPKTFMEYAGINVDYVRLGIGSGNVCFVKNTKVTMSDGSLKNIEDIRPGDLVKTMKGNDKVVNVFKKHTDSLIQINGTTCTPDHKFLVIKKRDKDIVTDENINEYAKWVMARDLTPDMLLVSE